MPLDAARSRARMASSVSAWRSDSATGDPTNDFRALTTRVLTSDLTPRLRAARRTPARACFFADAVRLATSHRQAGISHELRIISAHGIRARRQAPEGASRRVHSADRGPHRRRRRRGRSERVVWRGPARRRGADQDRRRRQRAGQRRPPLRGASPDHPRGKRERRAFRPARRLRRRARRARWHGRDHAPAQPPRCRIDARSRRRASGGHGGASRPHGRGRAGHRQESARRLIEQLGRHHRKALPGPRSRVSSQAESRRRELSIALPARAKLNLDLAILGRRSDGFHDVHTTLQAIDLHDLVTLTKAEQTTLTTSGLPTKNPRENSVLKALAALEQAANRPLPTHIHLHKRIPPGSGMGGASSDAAATLKALANLHHVTADLRAIAITLGADVPFFLNGGTAIADERGDHLTPIDTQPQWFAIAWPGVELPTPDVYRAWDATERPQSNEPNHLTEAAMTIEPRLREF